MAARFSDGKPTRKWMAEHDKKVFESGPSIGMGTIFISESEIRRREKERERREEKKKEAITTRI